MSKATTETPAAGFSAKWTDAINRIRAPVLKGLQGMTSVAVTRPKLTITSVVVFSLGIFILGYSTGFTLDVDEDKVWTPRGSNALKHMEWIDDESGFPKATRDLVMSFHEDGSFDILNEDNVARIFETLDAVRNLDSYHKLCGDNSTTGIECEITGVTRMWNDTTSIFDSTTNFLGDVSAKKYPDDGTPVADNDIFGKPTRDPTTGELESIQLFLVTIEYADDEDQIDPIEKFEEDALDVVQAIGDKWEDSSDVSLRVEVIADRSFSDEFERSIVGDLPLLPIVFVLMGVFTAGIFFTRNPVTSRSLLGFLAVISVLLSIFAGYGLLFCFSVSYTSMTSILPFVFFGVGLDDAFIITGSFFRLSREIDIKERVRMTVDDIGMSVFLTTLTSSIAFSLGGALSTIPGVTFLCVYAVPTIIFILLWQLTFFVACLVLDERRIDGDKRDCCRCCFSRGEADTTHQVSTIDRFMAWYAEHLLHPAVRVVVILAAVGLFIACIFSTTQLEQSFEFRDVLPDDSYIIPFLDTFDDYTTRSSVSAGVYFRDVDQSDPNVRAQMDAYMNELVSIDAVRDQPDYCWFRDFEEYIVEQDIKDEEFTVQLDKFLATPFGDLYHDEIIRNDDGSIRESLCMLPMDNVDIEDINNQIDTLNDQQEVSERQPLNKGRDELVFFTYQANYNIWEFYARSVQEITSTIIASLIAVTFVTLLLVPHWTAALYVFPLIAVLYVDLMGVMQWAGVSIDPISYISLVMSIGLLVDFVLHVLLRYYESEADNRREKTVDMLKTMGSSILIGGITTFLGTLPLAFSSSAIFTSVFTAFIGIVSLGATHGLIVLPVILSLIGPNETHGSQAKDSESDIGRTAHVRGADLVDVALESKA